MNITVEDLEFNTVLEQDAMKSLTGGWHNVGGLIHTGTSAVTNGSWGGWKRKSVFGIKYGNYFRKRTNTRWKFFKQKQAATYTEYYNG